MASSKNSPPVKVDNTTARSADDGLEGHFVTVEKGEHKGIYGVFVKVEEYAPDGYPKQIIVRSRDAQNELLSVPYADVKAVERARGGR